MSEERHRWKTPTQTKRLATGTLWQMHAQSLQQVPGDVRNTHRGAPTSFVQTLKCDAPTIVLPCGEKLLGQHLEDLRGLVRVLRRERKVKLHRAPQADTVHADTSTKLLWLHSQHHLRCQGGSVVGLPLQSKLAKRRAQPHPFHFRKQCQDAFIRCHTELCSGGDVPFSSRPWDGDGTNGCLEVGLRHTRPLAHGIHGEKWDRCTIAAKTCVVGHA
mmetsp:Transcript_58831/g.156604  ORF Transcript_58831/g.156604 Transcript_58831/m.156604 type:complete len:216 (+) Transcript_58831:183-830(+)